MKIGDLVKWGDLHELNEKPYVGIVVDGPQEGTNGMHDAVSYEIVWFNATLGRAWHNDYSLKLLSDCHRIMPDDLKGNEV